MKIMHISDLHLGKSLLEEPFYDDQRYILKQITDIVDKNKVEALLISGDIFDKNIPSIEAIRLFNDFLTDLNQFNIHVFIISGNHDSNERLGFASSLFKKLNIHIETVFNGKINKYTLNNIDFYLLPFIRPSQLKKYLTKEEEITNSNDTMKWLLDNTKIDKSKKNVLLMHQFVMNPGKDLILSDSESMSIGSLDAINANLLKDFDYVALGHIHNPQKVLRDTIRYSGTPLKYSFSEAKHNKSVVIIDISDNVEVNLIELKPLRELRVIEGSLKEILEIEPSNDIIHVNLTDTEDLLSPMEKIRKVHKNALSLKYINKKEYDSYIFKGNSENEKDVKVLFSDFFDMQNDREMNNKEKSIINSTFTSILEED